MFNQQQGVNFGPALTHREIGLVPPVEHETNHYRHNLAPAIVEASVPSLH